MWLIVTELPDLVIIEQSVKVNQKARILELKQRNDEEHYSDNLYAISIKEDTAVEQQVDDLDNGNLNVYERKVCYNECEKMYAEAVVFIIKKLVRLIDVTLEQWIDLKYDDHTMVGNENKGSVVATWLIRSYKKQFKEYMEIKKQKEEYGLDVGMEYDPSHVDFGKWLASNFSNYMTKDWYRKNALWIYWKRGDDEEVITDNELSNPGKESMLNLWI
uniref:C2 calcium/lipid-binding domain, CaLB n=1 Tax=Tanacetum cinerariifolium TaxID=118510 RepID=A0A6L2KVK9_TANCI|nr:C2 calcium/lipid-binding domain, CaLB [Tanacetum cinerariifolium]